MRLGKHQKRLLIFARKYAGWHTYANNRSTREVVKRLENRKLITVNQHRQFSIVGIDQMLRVINRLSSTQTFEEVQS